MAEKGSAPVARAVLQQCLQARLQVKPAEENSEAQFVQVRTPEHHSVHLHCRAHECYGVVLFTGMMKHIKSSTIMKGNILYGKD